MTTQSIDRTGNRVGKGEAYSDLEFAVLREFDRVDSETVVATTVHDCQVVEGRRDRDGSTRRPAGSDRDADRDHRDRVNRGSTEGTLLEGSRQRDDSEDPGAQAARTTGVATDFCARVRRPAVGCV